MCSDIEIWPPPDDPSAFESLCLDLYKEIWGDSGAQKNGRSGQGQSGVDVFGKGRDGQPVGVQCKQKSGMLRTKLTAAELKEEVKKASDFRPPLRLFIVATTGPRDKAIQARARELEEGTTFKIQVWSWPDLWHEIYRLRKLVESDRSTGRSCSHSGKSKRLPLTT